MVIYYYDTAFLFLFLSLYLSILLFSFGTNPNPNPSPFYSHCLSHEEVLIGKDCKYRVENVLWYDAGLQFTNKQNT